MVQIEQDYLKPGLETEAMNLFCKLVFLLAKEILCNDYTTVFFTFQKQRSRVVLRKKFSENRQQVYRRKPMPKCDFNKVTRQLY